MNEQKQQFRVGMFVIVTMLCIAGMIFQFGKMKKYWQPKYAIAIHFDSAPGVYPGTPVRRNGITIGSVREILFDDDHPGVLVVSEIRQDIRLRDDSLPTLTRSLLGDSSIEFVPGQSTTFLEMGSHLKGTAPTDPMQIVENMEKRMSETLDAFASTSQEWNKVGKNLNHILYSNQDNLVLAVEKSISSLETFSQTMHTAQKAFNDAGSVFSNPENQKNLQMALASLPRMVDETRQTIAAVKGAIGHANANLKNLKDVTSPLAKHSNDVVVKLNRTMNNIESISSELDDFVKLTTKEDGSLQRLLVDPQLYDNLNRSAHSLAQVLKNVYPISHDLRILSDKLARHPELLGVSGAFKGSSGIKDSSEANQQVRPASHTTNRPYSRRSRQ